MRVAVPPSAADGARQRMLWLHVSRGYRPGRAAPLVLALHGAGGTALGMQRSSGLSALADQRGFLVGYPQGLVQEHGKGPTGWDASGPADPYADGIDDGLYISDVLNVVQAGYCVDPRRIDATGFSNGGNMTGYLACVLAGRVAAFAPVEAMFFQIAGGCHPARPAAILDVHVLTDPVAPYAGVPSRGSPDFYAPGIAAWLQAWAYRDRCQAAPRMFARSAEVTAVRWAGCQGGAGVAGYRLASGGHSWFRALGASAGDRILLDFFAAHPLRGDLPGWSPGQAAPVPALAAPRVAVASLRVFRLPTPGAEPFDIVAGPDGAMWFTEFHADRIGRISPSGKITEYRVPTAGAGPYQIAAGPGGTVWFTEYYTARIGRVTGGQVSEVNLPRPSLGGAGITADPDGAISVADGAGYLDTITPAGQVSRVRLPDAGGVPFAVAAADGGARYVSELTGYFEHSRALLTLRPGRAAVPALTLPGALSDMDALAAGPAGTVWLTDFGAGQIGELLPGAGLRLFRDPSRYAGLTDIARGPDGAMWYTEQAGLIGRITPGGTIGQLALPGPGSNPDGIAAGPGRTIWVTGTGADTIVRIQLSR
jgi:poly(3-hydroxybutyrate) depolymerase/sugar lactone lactonase YvrE